MKPLQKLYFSNLGLFNLSYISNNHADVSICVFITLTPETQHTQMKVIHGTEATSHIPPMSRSDRHSWTSRCTESLGIVCGSLSTLNNIITSTHIKWDIGELRDIYCVFTHIHTRIYKCTCAHRSQRSTLSLTGSTVIYIFTYLQLICSAGLTSQWDPGFLHYPHAQTFSELRLHKGARDPNPGPPAWV